MNEQNRFIKDTLVDLCKTIQTLDDFGLTVLDFSVKDGRPKIEIIEGKNCGRLGHIARMTRVGAGGIREQFKLTELTGCVVSWKETA